MPVMFLLLREFFVPLLRGYPSKQKPYAGNRNSFSTPPPAPPPPRPLVMAPPPPPQMVRLQRAPAAYQFPDCRCDYHVHLLDADPDDGPAYHCARLDCMSYCYALNAVAAHHFPDLVPHRPLVLQAPLPPAPAPDPT